MELNSESKKRKHKGRTSSEEHKYSSEGNIQSAQNDIEQTDCQMQDFDRHTHLKKKKKKKKNKKHKKHSLDEDLNLEIDLQSEAKDCSIEKERENEIKRKRKKKKSKKNKENNEEIINLNGKDEISDIKGEGQDLISKDLRNSLESIDKQLKMKDYTLSLPEDDFESLSDNQKLNIIKEKKKKKKGKKKKQHSISVDDEPVNYESVYDSGWRKITSDVSDSQILNIPILDQEDLKMGKQKNKKKKDDFNNAPVDENGILNIKDKQPVSENSTYDSKNISSLESQTSNKETIFLKKHGKKRKKNHKDSSSDQKKSSETRIQVNKNGQRNYTDLIKITPERKFQSLKIDEDNRNSGDRIQQSITKYFAIKPNDSNDSLHRHQSANAAFPAKSSQVQDSSLHAGKVGALEGAFGHSANFEERRKEETGFINAESSHSSLICKEKENDNLNNKEYTGRKKSGEKRKIARKLHNHFVNNLPESAETQKEQGPKNVIDISKEVHSDANSPSKLKHSHLCDPISDSRMSSDDKKNESQSKKQKEIKNTPNHSYDVIKDEFLSPSNPLHKWKIDESDLEFLREKGIVIETGNWSKKESDILKDNVDKFRQREGMTLENFCKLVFESSYNARKLRKELELYSKIVTGINRPLKDIYVKLKQVYHPNNYKGEFTNEDKELLVSLQKKYGNKWKRIGEEMGRTGASVYHKFKKIKLEKEAENVDEAKMKNLIRDGRWLKSETQKLEEAIKQLSGTDIRQNVDESKIKWDAVAEVVGSRNPEQCRRKWGLQLSWKEPNEKIRKWKNDDYMAFITELLKSDVENEKLVNWELVGKNIGKLTSPQYMKRKWYEMKTLVPNYHSLQFNELLDWLLKNYISKRTEKSRKYVSMTA